MLKLSGKYPPIPRCVPRGTTIRATSAERESKRCCLCHTAVQVQHTVPNPDFRANPPKMWERAGACDIRIRMRVSWVRLVRTAWMRCPRIIIKFKANAQPLLQLLCAIVRVGIFGCADTKTKHQTESRKEMQLTTVHIMKYIGLNDLWRTRVVMICMHANAGHESCLCARADTGDGARADDVLMPPARHFSLGGVPHQRMRQTHAEQTAPEGIM